eukprot:jgi/Botrbrau1/5634/Bobra.55_1s0023.1
MPRLTHLCLLSHEHPLPTFMRAPAQFLANLRGVRHLVLAHVLAASRWDADVRCIAQLSELTQLHVELTDDMHHMSVPSSTSEHAEPLTALRQLKILKGCKLLAPAMNGPEFVEAVNSGRHEMGVPPLSLAFMTATSRCAPLPCRCSPLGAFCN